jgi:hypothetical protein
MDVVLQPNYTGENFEANIMRPYSTNTKIVYGNHPLHLMIKYKRQPLISHPVTIALYTQMWNSGGFYYFYFNLCAYIVFMSMLNAFALLGNHLLL